MSDGVKFVFKTLFKVPIIILAAYFIMNLLGAATTFFKVQGVQYGLENVITENNYISVKDLEKLMPQIWALGYHKDNTGTWSKTAYVEEIGFIVQNESGTTTLIPIDAPVGSGTNASTAAQHVVNNIDSTAGFTDNKNSPTTRSQYGRAKVIGCYANYAVLWPLTVYDDGSGAALTGTGTGAEAVQGFNGGNWNTGATPTSGQVGIFSGGNIAATGDWAQDTKNHANVIEIPIQLTNTVVGIKYYADLYE